MKNEASTRLAPLSVNAGLDFRRGNLLFGPMAYNVPPPLARVVIEENGVALQTRRPLRAIGQSIDIRIGFEEIERVREIPNGVILEIRARLFPMKTNLGPLTGTKHRSYSRVVITIPNIKGRKAFVTALRSRVPGSKSSRRSSSVKASARASLRHQSASKRRSLLIVSAQLSVGVAVLAVLLTLTVTGIEAVDITFALCLSIPIIAHALWRLFQESRTS